MSVYFVQAGTGGRIKVGYSPVPKQRVDFIRRFSGPDLFVLAVIEGPRTLEHRVHQLLAAHRHHGEWFDPVSEVLKVTERAASMPQDLEGRLNTLWATDFTWDEIDYYIALGGVVGSAALAVKSHPYSLT